MNYALYVHYGNYGNYGRVHKSRCGLSSVKHARKLHLAPFGDIIRPSVLGDFLQTVSKGRIPAVHYLDDVAHELTGSVRFEDYAYTLSGKVAITR